MIRFSTSIVLVVTGTLMGVARWSAGRSGGAAV